MKRNWLVSIYLNPQLQPWLLAAVLAIINIVFWIVVFTTFPRDMPAAVLHYSVGVGVDFVGESNQIMVLPLTGSVLLVLTVLLAYTLWRVSVAAVWILLGGNVMVQLLLIVAYAYILALN